LKGGTTSSLRRQRQRGRSARPPRIAALSGASWQSRERARVTLTDPKRIDDTIVQQIRLHAAHLTHRILIEPTEQ
jgi:hypothetical protein